MANTKYWTVGELYYVKLRKIVPGSTQRAWLGWMGYNADKQQYATFADNENVNPATDPNQVIAVQWVYEVEPDGKDGVAIVARYLRAYAYPELGSCLLGGHRHDGFYCYWKQQELSGMPGDAYALSETPVAGSDEVILARVSDNGAIYTYETWYLGYWKSGTAFEVTFEFIPAARFSATHEHWMKHQWATIGDRSLPDILIPGSHDAGSSSITRGGGDMTSKTQELGIHGQLLAGARYFDLRAWRDSNGVWRMYHGGDWTDVRLDYVIEQLATFLESHPQEIVIASLLVEDAKGTAAFKGHLKEAWNMMFESLHSFHLNHLDSPTNGKFRDINQVTPNSLFAGHRNFLLFNWGDAISWTITQPGGEQIFASPWSSRADGNGPGAVMDLDGVYVEQALATAKDILAAYRSYTRLGGMWILHTNTPWQFSAFWDSLYAKHERNAGQLAMDFENGSFSRHKANIVNIDFVGDRALGLDGLLYDLVASVIMANLK